MKGTLLFLGTGASAGVPMIGCECSVCRSQDPHDSRTRPSALLKIGGKTLLIDMGPDFRQQALRFSLCRIDGLLLTHTHYDHIGGIDEARVLNYQRETPLPCLLSNSSLTALQSRFPHLFSENGKTLACQMLPSRSGKTNFEGIPISFVTYRQQEMEVTGFRIGGLAYISDIRRFENDIFDSLKGVEALVLSALRPTPSNVHFSFDEAIHFANQVGAKETWLTHLAHELDHNSIEQLLPKGIKPAYDGLEITFKAHTHA